MGADPILTRAGLLFCLLIAFALAFALFATYQHGKRQ